jgi:hypothetical protein
LHDANGGTLASNDDWRRASNASEIEAAGLAPATITNPASSWR